MLPHDAVTRSSQRILPQGPSRLLQISNGCDLILVAPVGSKHEICSPESFRSDHAPCGLTKMGTPSGTASETLPMTGATATTCYNYLPEADFPTPIFIPTSN